MAIGKAKKNAQLIATGFDVKLGYVLDIKYNFEGSTVQVRRYDYLEEMQICDSSQDFNIIPEDTKYDESVSIVWEIEN